MMITRKILFDEGITFTVQNVEDVSQLPYATLRTLFSLPKSMGIYFVADPEVGLLYVGKAKSVRTRWRNHHRYEQLINDYPGSKVHHHKVEKEENLTILEDYFIKEFSPRLNSQPVPRYKKLSEWTEFVAEVPSRTNRGLRTITSGYDFGCHRDEECSAYGLYGDWIIDSLAEKLRWYNYRFENETNDSSKLWLKIDPQLYRRLAIRTFDDAQFLNSVIERLYKDGFIRMREEDEMVEIALRVKEESRREWSY